MKKAVALCLALILLLSCSVVAVSAESDEGYLKKLTPALIKEINDPTDVMIEVFIFLKNCPEAQHVEEIISQKYTWTNQQEHLMYYRKEMSEIIGAYVQKFVDDNADLMKVICQTDAAEFVIAEVSKDNVPKLAQLEIVKNMAESGADMMFVAFSSPKKEYWVNRYINELNIPFVMGVGGSFDVVAGVTDRAPKWMQDHGLEWFYRFIQEPKRLWNRYIVGNWKFVAYTNKCKREMRKQKKLNK